MVRAQAVKEEDWVPDSLIPAVELDRRPAPLGHAPASGVSYLALGDPNPPLLDGSSTPGTGRAALSRFHRGLKESQTLDIAGMTLKTVEPHPILGVAGFLVAGAGVVVAVIGFFLLWAILHTNLLVLTGILWAIAAFLLVLGVLLMGRDIRPSRRGGGRPSGP